MPVVNELLKRDTIDLIYLIGFIVICVILILGMLIVFFKVARIEKIGLGGIECDPEEGKPVKRRTRRVK